tara:strand:- start:208 stop:1113 length:906 start_codon:yes stop_codon:yes gene_type:complete
MDGASTNCTLDIFRVSGLNRKMNDNDPTGTDWTDREIALVVADYFDMLRKELVGEPYVKVQHNQRLQEMTGRSKGSIEFKHQNISAVLDQFDHPWISGYKPRANFQNALIAAIDNHLSADTILMPDRLAIEHQTLAEPGVLFFEQAPVMTTEKTDHPEPLKRLVRKFDPAARDARNQALGLRGEEAIFTFEQKRLVDEDRPDLSRKVKWVSQEEGDGAGFDILSFDRSGRERMLEVKTTTGLQKTPFYLTENERSLSEERTDAFRIVRLYDFARSPKAFEIEPPLENAVILRATEYRASFS